MHISKSAPAKTNAAFIYFPMCCHSIGSCMADRMRPRTQSVMSNISTAQDAVIRAYDEAGNMIETHEHKGDFNEW
jgi:hypothetical protein